MEGIKSRKVWVIAIATMKIRSGVGGRFWMKVRERRDIATRLMWMPGISPVVVPAIIPSISGVIKFSIYLLRLFC